MQEKSFIVFKEEHTEINPETFKILNARTASITYNSKWRSLKMESICPLISEWKTESLRLQYNECPTILKELSSCILFPYLTNIDLYENYIESIEGLHRMHLPSLQNLWLGINNITNLREFRKVRMPKINLISLSSNKICEGSSMALAKLQPKIEEIRVQFNTSLQINDVSFFNKLSATSINTIYITNETRIKREKLYETLKKKYINIKVKKSSES